MTKWTPQDIIALVMLVGAFGLRALGYDSFIEWIIIAVAIGYLGLVVPPRLKRK